MYLYCDIIIDSSWHNSIFSQKPTNMTGDFIYSLQYVSVSLILYKFSKLKIVYWAMVAINTTQLLIWWFLQCRNFTSSSQIICMSFILSVIFPTLIIISSFYGSSLLLYSIRNLQTFLYKSMINMSKCNISSLSTTWATW